MSQEEQLPVEPVSPRRPRRVLGRIGVGLTLLALAALLVRQVGAERGLLAYATAFVPYGIVFAVSGGVLLLLAGRWRWALVSGLVALASIAVQVPVMLPDPVGPSVTPVVVMTLNLHAGRANPQALIRTVQAHHVDLLALEELTPAEAHALSVAGLETVLPYVAAQTAYGTKGTALWSRWRLDPRDVQTGMVFRQVSAYVTPTGAERLSVAAVHAVSPDLPIGYDNTAHWATEQAELATWLRAQSGPVVALGDFNATLDQAPMRALLADGYHDAAAQSGVFWRPTWPYNRPIPPLIAIDHVLSRGGPVADQLTVENVAGSDHGALIVRLEVPTAAG